MLCKIKIPVLGEKEQEEFIKNKRKVEEAAHKLQETREYMHDYMNSIVAL